MNSQTPQISAVTGSSLSILKQRKQVSKTVLEATVRDINAMGAFVCKNCPVS